MADGVEIGKGTVTVAADMTPFDAAMAALPKKAADKMGAAMQALQARAKQVKLDIGVAYRAGDLAAQQKLIPLYENLKVKIATVEAATIKQGQAAQAEAAAAKAAAAEKIAAKAAERDAIKQAAQAARDAAQQMRQDAREQLADQRRVAQQFAQAERARLGGGGDKPGAPRGGGAFGGNAMGLMVLSQTIDDVQYGFRAIVNNIPQVGMALGSAFGMGTEAAMKFGAVAGIVAVALNYLITHWDDLLDSMGLGKVPTEAEAMDKLAQATRRTADEQERLNRFKREGKVIEEMGPKRSSGEEKTEAEVKALLADFGDKDATGFDRIVGGLAKSRIAQGAGEKRTDEEKAAVGDAKKGAIPSRLDTWIDPIFGALNRWSGGIVGDMRSRATKQQEINRRVEDANVERAKKDVAGAVLDPLKRRELIAEMRKNPGAFPGGAADALEGVIPAKNTAGQAKEDEARRATEFEQQHDVEMRELQDNENKRLAGAMTGSVGQKYLQSPTMSDETLQQQVKAAMKKAGMSAQDIADAMVGTAKELRKKLDAAVKDRALDRGVSEGVARQQLAKEANERDDKQAGTPKSEVMSTGAYLNKLLVASVSKPDATAEKALVAQQDTAKGVTKFVDLAEKWEARGIKVIGKDNPARVAPGR